jgi:N-sulfoglucosamine sulfohydrolase
MHRRLLLALFSVLLAAFSAQAAPRNVVLFVTDDHSPDAGCYGNPVIQTPNLDALAKEGVRFDRAYATTASCSASRSVILTGMHNHANGQYGHEHAYHHFRAFETAQSLPVLLAKAGYRTARIGKFHVGPEEVFHFETKLPGSGRSPVEMADNCRKFLAAEDGRPFFLYFCTDDPHRSGGAVAGDPLQPNPFGNRPQGYPGVKTVKYDPSDVIVPPFLPDTPVCRAELAQYYESVSRVDQGLGRLIQHLQEAGVYEDTLIIFTSDHGIAFPGAKTTLYQPGMAAPLIVRGPAVAKPGSATRIMVSHVDLTPTILDFAGALPQGHAFHGRSWLAAMNQEEHPDWNEVYASHTFHEVTMYYPMRVVRQGRYKLIWNLAHGLPFPFASDLWEAPTWQDRYRHGVSTLYGKRTVGQYIHRPAFELYDLEADPDEVRNLADDPQHAGRLAQMKAGLQKFQKRTADPWELKWRYE